MRILIVYNLPASDNSADDIDILDQVAAVEDSLLKLGYNVDIIGINLNLEVFFRQLSEYSPDLIFNLVEAINGVENYLHFIPVILEKSAIPFTGGSSTSLFITTNKVLTKQMLEQYNIPTPLCFTLKNSFTKQKDIPLPSIIKPVYADASVGLDDSSIVYDINRLESEIKKRTKKYGECFVEEFIDGREFNISIIETKNGPLVLPIAEIRFENYPSEKAKIVNYEAKWNNQSFEYHNTVRHFDFHDTDEKLLNELREITLLCWERFSLNGYARVDFRVDQNNNIYVLEINVNPCISPDSGFYAACLMKGWEYKRMISMILDSVLN